MSTLNAEVFNVLGNQYFKSLRHSDLINLGNTLDWKCKRWTAFRLVSELETLTTVPGGRERVIAAINQIVRYRAHNSQSERANRAAFDAQMVARGYQSKQYATVREIATLAISNAMTALDDTKLEQLAAFAMELQGDTPTILI